MVLTLAAVTSGGMARDTGVTENNLKWESPLLKKARLK